MTNRINFFATKNDMISILSKLEEQLSYEIKYIQCGKKDGSFYRTIIYRCGRFWDYVQSNHIMKITKTLL